jgi:hypothetical protein
VIAALLGFIPGVGAMYNGQFAKGIAHIIVFVILDALSKASDVFGILVAGWVFYQVFEAYHTARARREGLPLPDPFGLNDIGERFGFKGNWTHGTPWSTQPKPPAAGPIVTPPPAADPYAATYAQPYVAPYTPPAAYAPPVPPAASTGTFDANYQPPAPSYNPGPVVNPYGTPPVAPPSRFPTGAIWMIGLGVVFLVLTLSHDRFNFADIVPFLLAGLGIWLIVHKMLASGGLTPTGTEPVSYGARFAEACLTGGILLVIGILLGLQQFSSISMARSWPVLLIAIGAFLLVRRSVGQHAAFPVAPAAPPVDPAVGPTDTTQGGL